jgi:hypothetical protein
MGWQVQQHGCWLLASWVVLVAAASGMLLCEQHLRFYRLPLTARAADKEASCNALCHRSDSAITFGGVAGTCTVGRIHYA